MGANLDEVTGPQQHSNVQYIPPLVEHINGYERQNLCELLDHSKKPGEGFHHPPPCTGL